MRRARKERRKLNNHGFSLVEFLIAMAILGVVSLTIYSFMNTGARFYQRSSADADIQSEAQLVANAISNLIIDCEVNISYDDEISPGPGGGTPIRADGRILEISNSNYQFLIFHRGTNLFYLERRPSATNPDQYEAYNIDNAELLAQNITEFQVDLSRVSGKGKGKNIVTFLMTYEKGGRTYKGNYQVNLRNSITISANNITPVVNDENLTRITVTPSPVTIDVKGKDAPACPPDQQEKEFTANSDAMNVGRDDIFSWSMEDASGTVTYATSVGDTHKKKFKIRLADDLSDIPSSFRVIAESRIPNKDTGDFASGEAIVYFKKILNLNITPTRGVTNDCMDPESTAIFAANFTDYNLMPEDKRCTWKFEYKKGVEGQWAVCNNSSIATGRAMGSSYSVRLGSQADEHYSFRLTATSEWDPTWSAEYVFGVTEKAKIPGIDSPSRGVEIDMTALFTTGDYGPYAQQNMPGLDTIYDVTLQNFSGHDVEGILDLIVRDGKAYVYLDYGAVRYTSGSDALLFYNSPNIECVIHYIDKDGNKKSKDGVNWTMTPVSLNPSRPLKNGNILLPKGGTYDVTFTTLGYNISKKNQIGIYMETDGNLQNLNANEYGMLDFNPYLSANYTGPLGNRYNLIESGVFRITAKADQMMYPTDAIPMKVTIDDFYRLVTRYASGNQEYLERSSYDFNVYVSNVDGRDLFIKGPADASNWTTTTVVYNGTSQSGGSGNAAAAATHVQAVNVGQGCSIETANGTETITFTPVRAQDNSISYYEMSIGGQRYYYNTTYKCWRAVS